MTKKHTVLFFSLSSNNQIDMSAHRDGVYVINATIDSNQIKEFKVIKE